MINSRPKEILLIDDDEPTNFINKIILQKSGFSDDIIAMQSAEDALVHLINNSSTQPYLPDLIFLDINMPGMDGWQFLDKYKELPASYRQHIKVIMLSTSVNPDDKYRALQFDDVLDYISKPLTMEVAQEIIKSHFS